MIWDEILTGVTHNVAAKFGDPLAAQRPTADAQLPEEALIAEFHRAGIYLPEERKARESERQQLATMRTN